MGSACALRATGWKLTVAAFLFVGQAFEPGGLLFSRMTGWNPGATFGGIVAINCDPRSSVHDRKPRVELDPSVVVQRLIANRRASAGALDECWALAKSRLDIGQVQTKTVGIEVPEIRD